ncbi:MAG: HDOD domain-containing protein, partial [Desulfovibrionales bacterium]
RTGKHSYSQSVMIKKIVESVPSLPMYAGELISLINDPTTDARTIAAKVSEDPSVSAQVLKYVNSPYYGFQQTISDLQHAVMLLGFNQIYQLVLYHALRGTMPDTAEFRELQSHSIIISVLASEIAAIVRPDLQALASTIGLLHNFGESVIKLLKMHYPKLKIIFHSLEQEILGSMLLERWNLPQELCDSVSYQNCFRYAPAGFVHEPTRHGEGFLMIAHLVLDYIEKKESPDSYPLFISQYMKENGLSECTFEELVENHLIPRLIRKKKALPAMVRTLLQERRQPAASDLSEYLGARAN